MIKVIGLVGVLIAATASLRALCPDPRPKACSAFFRSDAVFVAMVTGKQDADDNVNIRFDVRVSKVLRGSVDPQTSVYTGNDTGRLLWDVGGEYVVFADREAGRWTSHGDCGPLSDPTTLSATLAEIARLGSATMSSIEGEVRHERIGGAPEAGVPIRVQGGGRTFQGRSDEVGFFRIPVPPGRYRVQVSYGVVLSDMSSVDLQDIRLVRGQCAQLALIQHAK